ncbi:MAG: hypothetical protein HQK67_03575, partial [Desulfamplus sp.]|nr:hypothetical protein [Desulfamplus sp.]
MRQISRFFVIAMFFSASALMFSCAVPAKKAKPAGQKSGESQNSALPAEQRLDEVEIRLQKIEKMLGIKSTQKQSVKEQFLDEQFVDE